MTLEVDGGFNNPVAVIAFTIWAILPTLAAGWAIWKREPERLGAWRWFIAALLFVLTPVARQLIGTFFLYALENPRPSRQPTRTHDLGGDLGSAV